MLFGQIALVLRLQIDTPLDRELEFFVRALQNCDGLAVVHAHEFRVDDPFQFRDQSLLDALIEEGDVLRPLAQHFSKANFSNRSARVASSDKSAKAISGSIIQNSARCRLVFEFSARNVGPKVYTLESARQYASTFSCPETVRNVSRPKKSFVKSIAPSLVRGKFARSSVETRNRAPAPSASEAVMIGVWIQKKPFSSKNRWIACAKRVADARCRRDDIRPRPQMRDLAQEFQGVRFGLDRIAVRVLHPADHTNRGRLHLEWLAFRRRRHDQPRRFDGTTRRELQDFIGVVRKRVRRDDLDGLEETTIQTPARRKSRLSNRGGCAPSL